MQAGSEKREMKIEIFFREHPFVVLGNREQIFGRGNEEEVGML